MLQFCHHTAVFVFACHRIGLHTTQTHNRRQHKTAPVPEHKNRGPMPKFLKSFVIYNLFPTCKIHKPNYHRHNSGDNPLKNRQPQYRFPKFFPNLSEHNTAILPTKKSYFKHTLGTDSHDKKIAPFRRNITNTNMIKIP